jgi:hypothetical protein
MAEGHLEVLGQAVLDASLRWEERRLHLAHKLGMGAEFLFEQMIEKARRGELREAQAGATTLGSSAGWRAVSLVG